MTSHNLFLKRITGRESFPVVSHDEAYEQYGVYSQKPSLIFERRFGVYSGDVVTESRVILSQDLAALHILKLRNVYWLEGIGLFTEDGRMLHPMYTGVPNGVFLSFDHDAPARASLTAHGRRYVENASPAVAEGAFYYCATSFAHYGHFVLESLPRLWALQHLPAVSSLFINNKDFGYEPCLTALGLQLGLIWSRERVVFFPELHVATQPYFLRWYCSEEARTVWRSIGNACVWEAPLLSDAMDRLYLSRRGVSFNRVLEEEELLEALFLRRGIRSIRPEAFDFWEQLVLFANASAFIAPYGSAIFSALFSTKRVGLFLMTHSEELLHHLVCFGDNVDVNVFFGEKTSPLNEQYPEIASFYWRIADKGKLLRAVDDWLASLRS